MRLDHPRVKQTLAFSKFCLFLICFYASTPYSYNPKQLAYQHAYSNLKWLYFTNLSLYLTLITVFIGVIYRYKKAIFPVYNVLLPMAITYEVLVTIVFWGLYSINPELIVNKHSLIPGNETPWIQELGFHLFPIILLFIDQIDVDVVFNNIQPIAQAVLLILWYIVITIFAVQKKKYIYPWMNKIEGHIYKTILLIVFNVFIYSVYRCYQYFKCKNKE